MNLELQAEQIIRERAEKIVERIEATLRAEAPVYTGRLLASIRTQKVSDDHWVIAPHTDYSHYAEYGNSPEGKGGRITPKHASVLRWIDPQGRKHYAKSVSPYEGSHFVRNTVMKYK